MSLMFLKRVPRLRAGFRSGQARGIATPSREEALQTAQKYAQKVYEQGQNVAGIAAESAKKYSGATGQRLASTWGSYREPLWYNLQVAREFLKQIYISERLAPPTSLSQITSVYQQLWQRASSRKSWQDLLASGEWKRVGIYALEAYGIFHIGEMIGRRSIVGYKLK